jgi:hypothetical protein
VNERNWWTKFNNRIPTPVIDVNLNYLPNPLELERVRQFLDRPGCSFTLPDFRLQVERLCCLDAGIRCSKCPCFSFTSNSVCELCPGPSDRCSFICSQTELEFLVIGLTSFDVVTLTWWPNSLCSHLKRDLMKCDFFHALRAEVLR